MCIICIKIAKSVMKCAKCYDFPYKLFNLQTAPHSQDTISYTMRRIGIWHISVEINSYPMRPNTEWDVHVSWSRQIYVILTISQPISTKNGFQKPGKSAHTWLGEFTKWSESDPYNVVNWLFSLWANKPQYCDPSLIGWTSNSLILEECIHRQVLIESAQHS